MSEEGRTYEMLWDCQFCGSTKLLGKTHRFCPHCGAPQNPDSRYFPSDEEKVAVEDHVFVGVDRTCASCGQLNSASSDYCQQCGAPMTDAARAKTLASEQRADDEVFASSGSRDVVKEQFDAEMVRVGADGASGKKGGFSKLIFVALAALLLVCGGLIFLFTRTESTNVIAADHTWERSVQVEEFSRDTGRDWRDQVPMGAYNLSCSREQRSTNRIPDGEECTTSRVDQGDGTYREQRTCQTRYREEPVYDDMCRYNIDRWIPSRTVDSSGSGLGEAPYWGEVSLNCQGQSRLGCEREASRSETYAVIFRDTSKDQDYTCDFTQDEWGSITLESAWMMDVRSFVQGSALCDTLQPR